MRKLLRSLLTSYISVGCFQNFSPFFIFFKNLFISCGDTGKIAAYGNVDANSGSWQRVPDADDLGVAGTQKSPDCVPWRREYNILLKQEPDMPMAQCQA